MVLLSNYTAYTVHVCSWWFCLATTTYTLYSWKLVYDIDLLNNLMLYTTVNVISVLLFTSVNIVKDGCLLCMRILISSLYLYLDLHFLLGSEVQIIEGSNNQGCTLIYLYFYCVCTKMCWGDHYATHTYCHTIACYYWTRYLSENKTRARGQWLVSVDVSIIIIISDGISIAVSCSYMHCGRRTICHLYYY